MKLKARNEKRLGELRTNIETGEVREADLSAVQEEIDGLVDELQKIKDELAASGEGPDGEDGSSEGEGSAARSGEESNGDDDPEPSEEGEGTDENRAGMISQEHRDSLLGTIKTGLESRSRLSNEQREQQIRQAFANFVIGRIDENEARSLGIESGNGSVTVPQVIASDVITYAQEENPLRRLGEVVKTAGNVEYPFLVKKMDANVNKKERTEDISETETEFDVIKLSPAEFDALATVTKKLLKMSGVPVEQIVIDELKKAYVRKEANYMFNGDDIGNENPGALAKKAVAFQPEIKVDLTASNAGQLLYDALIDLKNAPVTEIMKKGRFLINRAALKIVEKMKTDDGVPLLRPLTQAENGIGGTLVGYPFEVTDYADVKGSPDVPVFYFGDFYSFKIQDVTGALEIQRLIEKYAGQNKIGFQIYNLLDGQLIYSPFEPSVYRYTILKEG